VPWHVLCSTISRHYGAWEKEVMYLRLSARNFHHQHVRDFGDWNTGTYLHFQPNIIVIRTYTPKPQIQIEHYQTSKTALCTQVAYRPFIFQFTALCSGLQIICYIKITHQNAAFSASLLHTHFTHILRPHLQVVSPKQNEIYSKYLT